MASWGNLTIDFAPFDPLIPAFEGLLTVLQVVEAVLEVLLDIIKIFLLALLNPILAAVALLLAAVRALINQIIASGFSILLVHPDFSRPDIMGVFNSVSGAYPAFETKVTGKFYDTADMFRPMYPPGSATAMLIFYVGADSPGDLLGLIFQILYLLKHPLKIQLPAPIGLTARPVLQANGINAVATQFKALFDPSLQKAVGLEWRMPESPAGVGVPGLIGQVTSLYNSFRLPSFIVERTDSANPRGQVVAVLPDSTNLGKGVDPVLDRYSFPAVKTKYLVRDESGNIYRDFTKKILVDGTNLLEGALTGSYQYVDNDPDLVAGATYYYRVRAVFGDLPIYLSVSSPDDMISKKSTILFKHGNQWIFRPDSGATLGKASVPTKAVVPIPPPDPALFNPYQDLFDAVRVGILLNFDFPAAQATDNLTRQSQKTGWGTLSVLGGQMGPLKAAISTSDKLAGNFLVSTTCRRICNQVLDKLVAQPVLLQNLTSKWTGGVQGTVQNVLADTNIWNFIGIIGGVTTSSTTKIGAYLALEDSYVVGNPYTGPLPISPAFPDAVGVQQRQDLADFLRLALALLSYQTSYLHWYSVTLGDLLPPLIPFLNQLEQFILAILKALQDALTEITEIIETIIQKVIQLEQIVETILEILAILQINLTVSVLASASSNGSADQLVSDLQSSDNKPGTSPFGLHSGLVLTAGGPGGGVTAAIEALIFLFGLG